MNQQNNQNDYIEALNQEEGTEFDLRNYERQMFAKMYEEFLQKYFGYRKNRRNWEIGVDLMEISIILISGIKRYANHNEGNEDKAEKLESKCEEHEANLKKAQASENKKDNLDYTEDFIDLSNPELSNQELKEIKEGIEDLRHEANLKMPKKTSTNPEKAWKE